MKVFILPCFLLLWSTQALAQSAGQTALPEVKDRTGWAEQAPEFVGGQDSLKAYLYQNLTFTPKLLKKLPSKALVNFVVETDGRLSEIRVFQPIDREVANRIIKCFSQMPAWKPATYQKKPVRARHSVTIPFQKPR